MYLCVCFLHDLMITLRLSRLWENYNDNHIHLFILCFEYPLQAATYLQQN